MGLSVLIQKGGLARAATPATPATSATLATKNAKSALTVATVATVAVANASFDLDRFEERAAIMEHDGDLSRNDAERLAAEAQGWNIRQLRNRRLLH